MSLIISPHFFKNQRPRKTGAVAEQVEQAKAMHGFTCLNDVIMAGDTWQVD